MATDNPRVTAYIQPTNYERLKEYQQQYSLTVSQAVDRILGEYFTGGVPTAESSALGTIPAEASSTPSMTPPSDWLASVENMIEERTQAITQAIAERMEVLEQRLGEYERLRDSGDDALRSATEPNDYQQVLAERDKLDEQVSDLLLQVENLRDELNECRQQQSAAANECVQNHPPLSEVRDRVLAGLKLGKQAPGYKAAVKALDLFIGMLRECDSH